MQTLSPTSTSQAIAKAVRELFPQQDNIYLHPPQFAGNEWQYVKECIDTGWVSSVGSYVDAFEKKLAEFTGAKYAVVTTSGSAALHTALRIAGVQANDEVLLPALSFIAAANAISYCHATPHFIDSSSVDLGADAQKLKNYLMEIAELKGNSCINKNTGQVIRALCVVHIFGHPADLDALQAVCNQFNIALLEDAAEGLGSFYKNRHVGCHGLVGALSFNGNKIITTGGGGALLTDDAALAKRAKHLTTTAKVPHAWQYDYDEIGYNYRMPNINAALGCAQLEQLPAILARKRQLANAYQTAFAEIPGLQFVNEPAQTQSNFWLNACRLENPDMTQRDQLILELVQQKIHVRPVWKLVSKLPMYQHCPQMNLEQAYALEASLINLPSNG